MVPVAPTVLAGRVVRCEPLSLAHVPGLVAAATGGLRTTFALTNVPADEAAMRIYVTDALADQRAGLAIPFATMRGDEVVGSTRLGNIERWKWPAGSPQQRPEGCADAAEIGWTWLTPSAQRTAINTEAKLLMLGHAFEAWEVRRITLKTDERNTRSRAAIERLGARLDGILRGHMPAADQTVRASAVYSILAAEWPTVKAGLIASLSTRTA